MDVTTKDPEGTVVTVENILSGEREVAHVDSEGVVREEHEINASFDNSVFIIVG